MHAYRPTAMPSRCRRLTWPGAIFSAAALAFAGCADQAAREMSFGGAKSPVAPSAEAPAAPGEALAARVAADQAPPGAADSPESDKSPQKVAPAQPRKIVYNARVTLVVESVSGVADRLKKLVDDAGGYVSQTDETSYSKLQRRATWTVRVPVEKFEGFLAAVGRLGELQQNHVDSQDVTQEYYDIEARISNKQQEEKRLLKHLADSTGKLEDILAVERELSRVRGEVEQMQGRIRYLANVSAMSSVTITASEVRDYIPPEAPTFATQVSRTFHRSLENLVNFGEAVALVVVALVPWLPLLLVPAIIAIWAARRLFRRQPPVVLTRTAL